MYDKNNVFAKIIRGEIPSKKVIENEYAMSFYDVNPLCKTHVLVVPRGEYENILDFVRRATPAEQAGFWDCFDKTAAALGVDGEFNVFANAGLSAPLFNQSVFHFHLHLVAGEKTDSCFEIMKEMLCQE
ncbi:MAG: HIT domain-containing protein [Alphaproteobacteria bacterium]|nr:HIT domain-containing protein [Alphaproteobacteria bacterium]